MLVLFLCLCHTRILFLPVSDIGLSTLLPMFTIILYSSHKSGGCTTAGFMACYPFMWVQLGTKAYLYQSRSFLSSTSRASTMCFAGFSSGRSGSPQSIPIIFMASFSGPGFDSANIRRRTGVTLMTISEAFLSSPAWIRSKRSAQSFGRRFDVASMPPCAPQEIS